MTGKHVYMMILDVDVLGSQLATFVSSFTKS